MSEHIESFIYALLSVVFKSQANNNRFIAYNYIAYIKNLSS
jgi:hypothetical protein